MIYVPLGASPRVAAVVSGLMLALSLVADATPWAAWFFGIIFILALVFSILDHKHWVAQRRKKRAQKNKKSRQIIAGTS